MIEDDADLPNWLARREPAIKEMARLVFHQLGRHRQLLQEVRQEMIRTDGEIDAGLVTLERSLGSTPEELDAWSRAAGAWVDRFYKAETGHRLIALLEDMAHFMRLQFELFLRGASDPVVFGALEDRAEQIRALIRGSLPD